MKKRYFAVIAAISSLSSFSVYSAEPAFETISRCLFVYGAIFEVGRDTPHADLFHFAQVRVGYMTGYVQGNQGNPRFKQVFEENLSANKRSAINLQDSLKAAISSRNKYVFSSVINQAVACDRQIGIRTDFLPTL